MNRLAAYFAKFLAPFAFALFALSFAAVPAEAASLSSAQVNAVVSLISSFGVGASTIAQVEASLNGTAIASPPAGGGSLSGSVAAGAGRFLCPVALNLSQGATGANVVALQQYLASSTGFSAGATGYFGPLTAAAVKNLQAANGLPSTGFFGPMTRAKLGCGVSSPPPANPPRQASLSAAPASGAAPLAVSFSAFALSSSGPFVIDYGDGANSGSMSAACSQATPVASSASAGSALTLAPNCSFTTAHTYQSPGTYTAQVEGYIGCMWSDPHCDIATLPLATTTVVVQ
ncbi:MAG TPA: peptidoglycan-binding domain-containing protein [Candidatus Paceibacterota bacterium]|nr:peptidoglycan-binding domain-containing protein [Candidatus Paceibacterota bacterium]